MSGEDRPIAALEHLQRAVLEMIQAARSTLDLLEDVVGDPQILATVVSQVGQVAQALMSAASQGSARPSGPSPPAARLSGASEQPAARLSGASEQPAARPSGASEPAARPFAKRTGRPKGPTGGGVQRIPVT